VSEAVQGAKITVGPPFFNQVAGPIMVALIVLMGIGPLMPWRKASRESVLRTFAAPVGVAVGTALLLVVFAPNEPLAIVALAACAIVSATVALEFWRGAVARHQATGEAYPRAFGGLVRRNNRRYGGYVVHLGVVMMAAAVTASSMYQLESTARLRPGEALEIGGYRLTFNGLRERQEPGVRIVEARLAVESGGRLVDVVTPDKRFHRNFERQPSTQVAIRTTPAEDLYVVLGGWETDGSASFLVFVNPLVVWLWIGGIVALAGTLVAMWPAPRARVVSVEHPAPALAVGRA
jgi:cytochrome c-type biogenesis protein CcmF